MQQTCELGNSGIEVGRICLGTWNMGGMEGWGPDDDAASIRLIEHALDHGCTFIDTARGYGGGHAETLVGKAVGGHREHVVIATKMLHCPPQRVGADIDASLKALGTDYVDLYICHWPRPSLPLEPFFAEMARQREAGKFRALGVSNFNLHQMEIARRYGCVSLQPPMSILWRIPDPLLGYCRKEGIAITSYSSLAQGLLAGRFTKGVADLKGIRARNKLFAAAVLPHSLAVAETLDGIADKLGCTPGQAALAWLLRTPGVASVIAGASRPEQWDENLRALDVQLPDEDYDLLDREGKRVWEMVGVGETMWGWRPT